MDNPNKYTEAQYYNGETKKWVNCLVISTGPHQYVVELENGKRITVFRDSIARFK